MNFIKQIRDVVHNRELPLEDRIGLIYMMIGLLTACVGIGICFLVGASLIGVLAIVVISMFVALAMLIDTRRSKATSVRNILMLALMILIPIVFLSAGGTNSGCPAWLVFHIYFVALVSSGRMLRIYLPITAVIDLALLILDYTYPQYVYHLATEQDIFLSTIFSWLVVGAAILFTVVVFKSFYNFEHESLVSQSEELERANEHEKMFLANMSHELRTPINSIIGFNEMILRTSTNEEILDFATDVAHSSEHLLSLVNDILDLSKVEAGQMTFNSSGYSLPVLVNTAYNIVRRQAEEKGLELIVNVDPSCPKHLCGDKERILQMALNLLTNGIKYTKKGTVSLDIGVEYHNGTVPVPAQTPAEYEFAGAVDLIITVTDTGVGIAKDSLGLIFDAYRRVGNTKAISGTGLGLPITKTFAERMGGSIRVESKLGAGSTFTVVIPQNYLSEEEIGTFKVEETKREMRQLHKPTLAGNAPAKVSEQVVEEGISVVSVADEKAAFQSLKDSSATDAASRKSILICDDTPANLKVMRMLLKDTGHKIILVDSGDKAIKASEKFKLDLILMDIMMPGMSGVEAMQEIRKIQAAAPVIALTADAVSGAREKYLEDGFDDYLTKPVRFDALDEMLERFLGAAGSR